MTKHILVNLVSQSNEHPTGIFRGCLGLLEALSRRGTFRYTFRSTYSFDQLPSFFSDNNVSVITVPKPKRLFVDAFMQAFSNPRLCRKIGADAILNVDCVCAPFGGPPSAVIAHDFYANVLPECYSTGERLRLWILWSLLSRTSDAILPNSLSTAKDLLRFMPHAAEKVHTVYHDQSIMKSGRLKDDDVPVVTGDYVVVVGAGSPNKNLKTIGEAIKIVNSRSSRLKIVHIGYDMEEQIRQGLGSDGGEILYMRGVEDAVLRNVYRHAICLVNASLYEGFCLPILEAQRNLCPVVCSSLSAAGEIGGDGALQCDPRDPAALARAVESLLDSPGLRESLRKRGLTNAERFSWDRSAALVEEIFGNLLACEIKESAQPRATPRASTDTALINHD